MIVIVAQTACVGYDAVQTLIERLGLLAQDATSNQLFDN